MQSSKAEVGGPKYLFLALGTGDLFVALGAGFAWSCRVQHHSHLREAPYLGIDMDFDDMAAIAHSPTGHSR